MTHSEMLQVLKLKEGMDDVTIAVALGKVIGGKGPSPFSVYRWRIGKHKPTRVFHDPITALYEQKTGDKNDT
tara:strand:- start:5163 stop:5378 length:216 start_codon:yes stop_codon:yes gene_type:complete